MYSLPDIDTIVAVALGEDLAAPTSSFMPGATADPALLDHDVTGSSVIGEDVAFRGTVTAREACVVCGLPVVAAVYDALSRSCGLFDPIEVFPLVAEGSRVEAGAAVAEVTGMARPVLAGERTALNFIMVLSGIATETARWVVEAEGRIEVCDTRKTAPGLRAVSKYAVLVGGGANHRIGLNDMVLVKDNHLRRTGITTAVSRARSAHPALQVEVEAETAAQAVEAVKAGADIVLLDNMDPVALKEAVSACRSAEKGGRKVLLEVSGGVKFEDIRRLADSGVDRLSTSALTFTRPMDFALDEVS